MCLLAHYVGVNYLVIHPWAIHGIQSKDPRTLRGLALTVISIAQIAYFFYIYQYGGEASLDRADRVGRELKLKNMWWIPVLHSTSFIISEAVWLGFYFWGTYHLIGTIVGGIYAIISIIVGITSLQNDECHSTLGIGYTLTNLTYDILQRKLVQVDFEKTLDTYIDNAKIQNDELSNYSKGAQAPIQSQ